MSRRGEVTPRTVPASHAARGPVLRSERVLAPDLARGAMLLVIALANAAVIFFADAPGYEPAPEGLERAYDIVMFTFVHARGLPMFALLFGYALVQLTRRQDAAAASPAVARAVLLRRNAWLLAFGLVHGALLFSGDVLGAYGVIGIVITLFLLRRTALVDRIARCYWAFSVVYVLGLGAAAGWGIATTSGSALAPTSPFGSVLAPDYGTSVLARLGEWPGTVLSMLGLVLTVLGGMWAAQRRVLEEPGRHLGFLRWCAAVGGSVAVAGGLPMGLLTAGYLHVDDWTAVWVMRLYEVSGQFGGLCYVALFGLLAHALSTRGAPRANPVVGAVAALGQRSLSGYLFQSVAWLVLASPFALGLGHRGASTALVATACAVGVWLASVAGAYAMQRRSYRGPAEILLRRLTYGAATTGR